LWFFNALFFQEKTKASESKNCAKHGCFLKSKANKKQGLDQPNNPKKCTFFTNWCA